jgi:hypothetical protein
MVAASDAGSVFSMGCAPTPLLLDTTLAFLCNSLEYVPVGSQVSCPGLSTFPASEFALEDVTFAAIRSGMLNICKLCNGNCLAYACKNVVMYNLMNCRPF